HTSSLSLHDALPILLMAGIFGMIAALGPLYWLAHNWWLYNNPLEFYNGPYSPRAIYQRALAQKMDPYPGDHDWGKAWLFFRTARSEEHTSELQSPDH